MSSRGRSTTVKRGVLPNLSLAGKREGKVATDQPKRKKTGRQSHRGGRGRGRGGRERPGLIESAGIFSEGLSGGEPGRRRIADPVLVKQVKEETVDVNDDVKRETTVSGYAAYDEIWRSDDEEDLKELSDLFRDDELQSQFIDLMDEKVRCKIQEQEEILKTEIEADVRDDIQKIQSSFSEDEVDEKSDAESPTLKQSRKAARILRSMTKEDRENELFMIQLPGILKVLSQEKPDDNVIFNNSRLNGSAGVDNRENVQGITAPDHVEKPKVEQLSLPSGRSIGKLVVTKDGRVILKAGGHSLDIAHTASEGQHQGVVIVETAQSKDGYAMQNGSWQYRASSVGSGQRNAIYYMGHVRHHLTASLDWTQLKPIGLENTSKTSSESFLSPSRKPKTSEVERMRKELDDLQQRRSRDMAAALKRWGVQ